jgi:hypothetical protein
MGVVLDIDGVVDGIVDGIVVEVADNFAVLIPK